MKLKRLLIIISLIVIIIGFSTTSSLAATFNLDVNYDGEEITMVSNDGEVEFSNLNLLPGETDESYINITNVGKNKVTIYMTAKIIEDEKLIDVLQINVINSKNEQLFSGKYSEFTKAEIVLDKNEKETITIKTIMPIEAGNEYQDKLANVEINFEANGKEIPVAPQTNQSNVIIYSVLIAIVIVLIVALIVLSKKNKNKEE